MAMYATLTGVGGGRSLAVGLYSRQLHGQSGPVKWHYFPSPHSLQTTFVEVINSDHCDHSVLTVADSAHDKELRKMSCLSEGEILAYEYDVICH